jgi:hypothetical protein
MTSQDILPRTDDIFGFLWIKARFYGLDRKKGYNR